MVCEQWDNSDPTVPHNTVCAETWSDSTWVGGRKGKGRVVHRIVVNHDPARPLSYGDVLLGSTHAVISILVAHPAERRWIDYTKGDAAWAETAGLFEHEHPAVSSGGRFLTGESTGLALNPIDNVPWFSNRDPHRRAAGVRDHGAPELERLVGRDAPAPAAPDLLRERDRISPTGTRSPASPSATTGRSGPRPPTAWPA